MYKGANMTDCPKLASMLSVSVSLKTGFCPLVVYEQSSIHLKGQRHFTDLSFVSPGDIVR